MPQIQTILFIPTIMHIILQKPGISGQWSLIWWMVWCQLCLWMQKALANPPPHCLLTLHKPFFTSEMVVRDLTTDFVSFCKSFVCKLPAGNDAKHHVPDQLPRLVTEPG